MNSSVKSINNIIATVDSQVKESTEVLASELSRIDNDVTHLDYSGNAGMFPSVEILIQEGVIGHDVSPPIMNKLKTLVSTKV